MSSKKASDQRIPGTVAALLKPIALEANYPQFRWLLVLAAIFFAIALTLSLNRYYSLYASYDQGIFNQVYWNSLHGRFFQSSLSSTLSSAVLSDGEVPDVTYRRLGQHFTPSLMLWLPFYALRPSADTLLVIQVLLMMAAGLVLYALARQYLQPGLSLLITASFYAANAVIGPTLSNFHDSCQTPLLVFSLLLAMEKRVWWLFWLLSALVLGVREDAGIILFGIGVYLVLSRRYPRVGLALCTVSFGYILLSTNFLMSLFSDDSTRRFTVEHFRRFKQAERASTVDVLLALLRNPVQLVLVLVTPIGAKLKYLFYHWLPLAFVPAISLPAWIMGIFPILALFIRDPNAPGDPLAIHIRYAITVVPALFYGAILWWSQHPDWFKSRSRQIWIGCMILSLLLLLRHNPHQSLYFMSGLKPFSHNQNQVSLARQWEHSGNVRAVISQIPADASVSTTTYIAPHLSSRREIIRFLGMRKQGEEIQFVPTLEVRNDQRRVVPVDYLVLDLWQMDQYRFDPNEKKRLQALVPMLDQVISQGKYGLRTVNDGVVLLQRGTSPDAQAANDWATLREQLRPSWQTS